MPNIEKYSSKLPAALKLGLINHLFNQNTNKFNAIELIISINEFDINIKSLSSYLDFIYRIDGQLSEIGPKRYVHYPQAQIHINQIRFGSWEIVIERLINSVDAEKLGILFLALRFLPEITKTITDGIRSYYETMNTREDYLEKREKRRIRKEVRELINVEDGFSTLEKKQKEKLVSLLEELYKSSEKILPSASRLAHKSVKGIKIRPTKKNTGS